MKSAAFFTLGCKVNQYDTEAMLERFKDSGYEIVSFDKRADVYLINTCTVTGTGDSKSKKLIRRKARENPDCDIIVAGCLAQREADSLIRMDNVRLVIGVQNRAKVVELYERAVSSGEPVNAVEQLNGASFEKLFVTRHEGKTRATMKIQEGCDRYCSYCIIPYVRGPIRSMPLASVRDEAKRLSGAGYKEIIVTGIHMGSYGKDTGDSLIDAIRAAHDAGARIRLGSLEPVTVTDEFAYDLSGLDNLMRQFHLSLQSGSQSVLERMKRRYTPEEYIDAVKILRKYMPDCAITTDVLTGFPGETDEEARQTLDFVEKCGFARIHVFPYSRRKGTRADLLPDQISEEVKHARTRELIALGNKLEEAFVNKTTGSVQSVLFETSEKGLSSGYTQHYVRVFAPCECGTVSTVRIVRTEGASAYGIPYYNN